jgi:excisionase family DNA binding protein
MVDVPRHKSLFRPRDGADLPAEAAKDNTGLLCLRFDIAEAARILKFSRATLYSRISSGAIRTQKDGRRTYITRGELERYVASRD